MRESESTAQFSQFHAPLGGRREKNAPEQYLKSSAGVYVFDRISVSYWQADSTQVERK
jgi:hypothetical protein